MIPLNSTTKFGLIQESAIEIFNTVEDIMNASELPKIVTVTALNVGKNDKPSLVKNEILVIRGVVKFGGRFKVGRVSMLKVFSITEQEEKILSKDVVGMFTTDPF